MPADRLVSSFPKHRYIFLLLTVGSRPEESLEVQSVRELWGNVATMAPPFCHPFLSGRVVASFSGYLR